MKILEKVLIITEQMHRFLFHWILLTAAYQLTPESRDSTDELTGFL